MSNATTASFVSQRFFFFLGTGAFERVNVSGSNGTEEVVAGGSVVSGVVAGGGTAEAWGGGLKLG